MYRMPIKFIRRAGFVAAIFLVIARTYAAEVPGIPPEAYAQARADVEAKNIMLQAKHEIWIYGTTRAMATAADGSYISLEHKKVRLGPLTRYQLSCIFKAQSKGWSRQ